MATRSRTKSAAAVAAPPDTPSSTSGTPRSTRVHQSLVKTEEASNDDAEKENDQKGGSTHATQAQVQHRKTRTSRPARSTAKGARQSTARGKAAAYCSCRQPNDGTPMVYCVQCADWYHFRCVNLDEDEASEIAIYVCPDCTSKTGRCTVMEWEGPEALEPRPGDSKQPTAPPKHSAPSKQPQQQQQQGLLEQYDFAAPSESEGGPSSEDEYVAESDKQGAAKRARRLSLSSDSDADAPHTPAPQSSNRQLKRKQSGAVPPPAPLPKRKKSSTGPASSEGPAETVSGQPSAAAEDPARKYCLGKLQETFRQIFMRYPHAPSAPQGDDSEGNGGPATTTRVPQNADELTEEDKQRLQGEADAYSAEVERACFDLYAEPDKRGRMGVATKYKERFRMLTFNLNKPDRVAVHTRIASGSMDARELAQMSSTELANEETKQSIAQIAKESLAQTILQKSLVPSAKITHKGFEDIEDVNGAIAAARETERERDREREEEERRERERRARKEAAQRQQERRASQQGPLGLGVSPVQRQSQEASSVPPESPLTPHTPGMPQNWGAPPPLPPHVLESAHAHAQEHHFMSSPSPIDSGGNQTRPPPNPLFMSSASDFALSIPEPELNLADLINLDDEPSLGEADAAHVPTAALESPDVPMEGDAIGSSSEPASVTPPAQAPSLNPNTNADVNPSASPATPQFADPSQHQHQQQDTPTLSKPETPSRASFSLDSIWSDLKEKTLSPTAAPARLPPKNDFSIDMDIDITGMDAHDHDFDKLLEKEDQDTGAGVGAPQPDAAPSLPAQTPEEVFEASPFVWKGNIAMPLDSSIPKNAPVVARQIGGRTLGEGSPLWRTLFPVNTLRIDGRVPVDSSAQFLLQMRLNTQKEVIAVAFSPEEGNGALQTFSDFLIGKGRHGLVFPWGTRPKEHHPGKELYMVPLLASHALPDYIELLEELRLPKERTKNYVLGLWILAKGKLTPPPDPASGVPASASPSVSVPPPPAHSPSALHPHSSQPHPHSPASSAGFGTYGHGQGHSTPIPGHGGPSAFTDQVHGLSSSLVNSVAALTPDQIQEMLRQLASGGALPYPLAALGQHQAQDQTQAQTQALGQLPGAASPAPYSTGPNLGHGHAHALGGPPHSWGASQQQMPPFPPNMPHTPTGAAAHSTMNHLQHQHTPPPSAPGRGGLHHSPPTGPAYGRERGDRGGFRGGDRGRGRGRGRGGGRGSDGWGPRSGDRSWSGQRGRERSSSGGHSRWDEPPPRWP